MQIPRPAINTKAVAVASLASVAVVAAVVVVRTLLAAQFSKIPGELLTTLMPLHPKRAREAKEAKRMPACRGLCCKEGRTIKEFCTFCLVRAVGV